MDRMDKFTCVVFVIFVGLFQTGFVRGDRVANCEIQGLTVCKCTSNNSSQIIKVDCTDVHFTNDSGLHGNKIPKTVETVIFKDNDVKILHDYLLGTCQDDSGYENLKLLDLSNNNIGEIQKDTFKCMPYLEKLILDDNYINIEKHTPVFKPLDSLKTLSVNNAFYVKDKDINGLPEDFLNIFFYGDIIDSNGKREHDLSHLEELYMSNNSLHEVVSGVLCDMQELRLLNLSHNLIRNIDAVVDCFEGKEEKLEEIYLDHNRISSPQFLDETSDITKWKKINVAHNPYMCDCKINKFQNWLHAIKNRSESVLLDSSDIKCNDPALRGKTLFEVQIPPCQKAQAFEEPHTLSYVLPIIAVVLIVSGVLFYIIGAGKCEKPQKLRRRMVSTGLFKNPAYKPF